MTTETRWSAEDVEEFRTHGHLSLCERLAGGEDAYCSCGYEEWLEEQQERTHHDD